MKNSKWVIVFAAILMLATVGVIAPSDGIALTYHTISIDGTNDFSLDETLGSSSISNNWYVTWNSSSFFVGVDVIQSPNTWISFYLGTDTGQGSLAGIPLNNQNPTLPFFANYNILYNVSTNNFMSFQWNGSQWVNAAGLVTGAYSGNFFESNIPLAGIGNPSNLYLVGAIVNATSGSEWTYGMLPSLSGLDGFDPDFSHWLGYNLASGVSPNLNDHVDAAPVPIPGAAWLLGSGIVGLIGLKRRMRK